MSINMKITSSLKEYKISNAWQLGFNTFIINEYISINIYIKELYILFALSSKFSQNENNKKSSIQIKIAYQGCETDLLWQQYLIWLHQYYQTFVDLT